MFGRCSEWKKLPQSGELSPMRGVGQLAGWAAIAMMTSACHRTERPERVGFYRLDTQRLSGATAVRAKEGGFSGLTVLVTVGTSGKVISAQVDSNLEHLDPAPGLAAARAWTFRPQQFDGKPVIAVGRITIEYLPFETPPNPVATFPAGRLATAEITLERGACYGPCPDYRVTIAGDGAIRFDTGSRHFAGKVPSVHLAHGGNNVLLPGSHVARTSPERFARLLQQFRAAHFFGLKDQYADAVTDNSTQRLTVRIGAHRKSVNDYVGTQVGMPTLVRDLEDAVDVEAGTERWVGGNAETIAYLDQQRFDFRSPASAELLVAAARRLQAYRPPAGLPSLIFGLLARGAPLDRVMGNTTAGKALLFASAAAGNEALFAEMMRRGQLAKASQADLNRMVVRVGCSPGIARALVQAGADPRHTEDDGSALNRVTGVSPMCGDDEARSVKMARVLIDLGIPLETRNSIGWTALMGCNSPELAKLLIQRGANINVKDENGTAALLSTDDDRVGVTLLRAGANPDVRDKEGSLRQMALRRHMPATLAWLDANRAP